VKVGLPFACVAIAFGLALQGCYSPQQSDLGTYDPSTIGHSLAIATREFCVPYIVDGASITTLTQRPALSERHYSVHGRDVPRYRFDDLPGAPEATPAGNDQCWIGVQDMPESAIPATVAAFKSDLQLDGYATSKPHFVPGPHTLVVGEPTEPGTPPHSYSTCIHGRGHALIQMSGYTINVTSDPGILADQSCTPA